MHICMGHLCHSIKQTAKCKVPKVCMNLKFKGAEYTKNRKMTSFGRLMITLSLMHLREETRTSQACPTQMIIKLPGASVRRNDETVDHDTATILKSWHEHKE